MLNLISNNKISKIYFYPFIQLKLDLQSKIRKKIKKLIILKDLFAR